MTRQYVFLVHGMGKQTEGEWHKSFVEAIVAPGFTLLGAAIWFARRRLLDEAETDVKAGDSISSLFIPGKGTRFYFGQREIGYIIDNDFGPAFLAIWLDPNTREKRMRKNLLLGLISRN